jgi:integrase
MCFLLSRGLPKVTLADCIELGNLSNTYTARKPTSCCSGLRSFAAFFVSISVAISFWRDLELPTIGARIRMHECALLPCDQMGMDREESDYERSPELKNGRKAPDVLTPEEIMAFLKELPDPLRTMIELDAFTGLRRGELIGLGGKT